MFDQPLFYNGLYEGNSPVGRARIISQLNLLELKKSQWLNSKLDGIRTLDTGSLPSRLFWRPDMAVAITILLVLCFGR